MIRPNPAAQAIRARLDHPVIDSDGHFNVDVGGGVASGAVSQTRIVPIRHAATKRTACA